MREKISKHRSEIMAICIFLVYFNHLFYEPAEGSIGFIIHRNAILGVDAFIVLSMFGLYHSFEKNPITNLRTYWQYLFRRILRIYVVYAPVTVMYMLIDNWSIKELVRKLLLIDQLTQSIYVHLWYIPCIIIFYIFAPFCYMLVKKVKNVPLLTVALSVALYIFLFTVNPTGLIRRDINAILTRIPDVFLGFMLATYDDSLSKKARNLYAVLIAVMALFGAGLVYYEINYGFFDAFHADNVIHSNLLVSAMIVVLALIFDAFDKLKATAFINKALALIGTLTLEIYCLHEWVWKYISPMEIKLGKRHIACALIIFVASMGLNRIGRFFLQKPAK
ncbi:acyltransferase [Butyrivibrio sp. DSM 10294]|uniref:acyltransferase family protein n=1 Tax=Butyrivibrio sp. DSM 10294 TaxID=2972457 RepID=UPI00234E739F|nr:acyltransferase [Butyrivibrio sp. DSM 10294]MDC7294184.1 acyltransferase [Butyrivibrio sp. DSM 10294]